MSDSDRIAGHRFTLAVDDVEYPLDVSQITARQVGEIELGFLLEVGPLISALSNRELGLRQVAALCYLSERQAGRQASPDRFLDGITLASTATVTYVDDVAPSDARDADPEA